MRLQDRSGWFGGLVRVTLVAALSVSVGSAQAAFPGRNGLLAVQPLEGSGIVLIKADGHGERRACAGPQPGTGAFLCSLARPRWSADGRSLVVGGPPTVGSLSVSREVEVIYPDGTCLDGFCGPVTLGADAAFTNNSTLLTAVQGLPTATPGAVRELVQFGIDGLVRGVLPPGAVSDAVWSSHGELAVVRGGSIWVGRPKELRRLTRGGAPSWSPGGSEIVFVRRGWLMVGRVRDRSFRRLVRGTAPAWSPDGRWVAFFDDRHRLSIVSASGGGVRHVGEVTGSTVDWQPLPAKPSAPCLTPPGSTVIASSNTAVVSVSHGQSVAYEPPLSAWAAMGCLRGSGRERLLARVDNTDSEQTQNVGQAAVAGTYAALVINGASTKYGSFYGTGVELFDLRTGCDLNAASPCDPSLPDRGGEGTNCTLSTGVSCQINQLVLGRDAVSTVHTTVRDDGCSCTVEQIQASDSTGVHTLDNITEPDGSPAALTNLTLIGDTLTWEHNGTPRSAQLQP